VLGGKERVDCVVSCERGEGFVVAFVLCTFHSHVDGQSNQPHQPTPSTNPTTSTQTQLWGGNPVKFIRKLDDDEVTANAKAAEQYHALANEHANEFQPFGAAYLDAEKAKTSA
jgi:carbonic anhydrase/acetyltransferase-like protein (isoleucine patch superfamily)